MAQPVAEAPAAELNTCRVCKLLERQLILHVGMVLRVGSAAAAAAENAMLATAAITAIACCCTQALSVCLEAFLLAWCMGCPSWSRSD